MGTAAADTTDAYPEALARHYDGDYAAVERGPDAAFYVDLARAADGPVMEMACGTGRVLVPMARAGASVTGIDPSPAMRARLLAKLATEPEEVRGRVTLLAGRFDRVPCPGPFALVCSPFRAFQHLLTREAQLAGLRAMAAVLAPDGLLAFDVFDFDPVRAAQREQDHVDCTYEEGGATIVRTSRAVHDAEAGVMRVVFRWSEDGVDTGEASPFSMRIVRRDEMDGLLAEAGLALETVYADFERSPWEAGRPRELVVLARRAAAAGR